MKASEKCAFTKAFRNNTGITWSQECYSCDSSLLPMLTSDGFQTCIASSSCNFYATYNNIAVCFQENDSTRNKNNCTHYIQNSASNNTCVSSCPVYDLDD